MIGKCERSGFLRSCGNAAIAACQYCGRGFCDEHGERLDDDQEICGGKTCQQKREDLALHFAYKEAVELRNAQSQCGATDCGNAPVDQCAKCQGLFCRRDVDERDYDTREGGRSRGSVCDHCHRRRRLWSRR